MSPRGDVDSAQPTALEARANLAPSRAPGARAEVLPLRLSVARGGIGIELAQPVQLGPLSCEQLEVELPGISYPVDLSKGVKQFRARRSALASLTITVILDQLAELWARALGGFWGEQPHVRLGIGATGVGRATPHRAGDGPANENHGLEAISVCIYSLSGALAFDLVVTSGQEPTVTMDAARSWGNLPLLSGRPASAVALQALRAVLVGFGVDHQVSQRGRALVISGLARALCLEVFPQLGFRVPQVETQVLVDLSGSLGQLRLRIAKTGEAWATNFHALRLANLGDFLREADDHLREERRGLARAAYVRALDTVPGQGEVLLELAELDLVEDRAESAVVFLDECRDDVEQGSRKTLLLARALDQTGRKDAAQEMWKLAAEQERDRLFSAYLYCDLAQRQNDPIDRRKYLDEAVARSPLLAIARRERLGFCLAQGDRHTALVDAEQLEALLISDTARAQLLAEVAPRFAAAGFEDEAVRLLRRALRLDPLDPRLMVELGELLHRRSESLRAAELLLAALRRLTALEHPGTGEQRESLMLCYRCRFLLAQIMVMNPVTMSEALIHLGAIPTRCTWGPAARLAEVEIFQKRGNLRERDHAVARWIETAELGWTEVAEFGQRFAALVKSFDPPLESAVAAALHAIIQNFGAASRD